MGAVLNEVQARRAEWLVRRMRLPVGSLQARAAVLFAAGLFSIGFLAWFATDQSASANADPAAPLVAARDDSSRLLIAMLDQQAALDRPSADLGPGRFQATSAEQDLRTELPPRFHAQLAATAAAAADWEAWADGAAADPAAADFAQGKSLFASFVSQQQGLDASIRQAADGAELAGLNRRHADSAGMALAASAAVVTILLLIHLLLVQVVRPVWRLAAAAAALARDGDAEVPHTDRRDEVGALATALLDWRYTSAERLAMAKLAAEGEARFHAVFDHAPIGVLRLALNGRILDTNPTLQRMVGRPAEEMARLSIGDLSHPEDRARLQELQDKSVDRFVVERRYVRRDGSIFWGLMTVALARMQDGRPLFYVAMVEDITERKQREHNLHLRATTDALTGLANRSAFVEALAATLADRRLQHSAVFMLDLNGFKQVNDNLGHAAGDELLRQVGRRLFEVMRTSDLVARLGGDEFAVLLPGTDAEGAEVAARKVFAELARPLTLGERRVQVGASIGVALVPEHGTSVDDLMAAADAAMYRAKRSGGGVELVA